MDQDSIDIDEIRALVFSQDEPPSQSPLVGPGDASQHPRVTADAKRQPNSDVRTNAHLKRARDNGANDHDDELISTTNEHAPKRLKLVESRASSAPPLERSASTLDNACWKNYNAKMSTASSRGASTQEFSQHHYKPYLDAKLVTFPTASTQTDNVNDSTRVTGDDSYINLGCFPSQAALATALSQAAGTQDVEELDNMTQIDITRVQFPEDLRFNNPKTPHTQGKKRDHDGNVISPAIVTPAHVVNPFGSIDRSGGATLGLSQLFATTQAQTSPLPPLPPSDPASAKPSPHLGEVVRARFVENVSSPRLRLLPPPLSQIEPHDNYVSITQSQEERDRAIAAKGQLPLKTADDFDVDLLTPPKHARPSLNRAVTESSLKLFERTTAVAQSKPVKPTALTRSIPASTEPIVISSPELVDTSKSAENGSTEVVNIDTSETVLAPEDGSEEQPSSDEETIHDEDVDDGPQHKDDIDDEEDKENKPMHSIQVPRTTNKEAMQSRTTQSFSSPTTSRQIKPLTAHHLSTSIAAVTIQASQGSPAQPVRPHTDGQESIFDGVVPQSQPTILHPVQEADIVSSSPVRKRRPRRSLQTVQSRYRPTDPLSTDELSGEQVEDTTLLRNERNNDAAGPEQSQASALRNTPRTPSPVSQFAVPPAPASTPAARVISQPKPMFSPSPIRPQIGRYSDAVAGASQIGLNESLDINGAVGDMLDVDMDLLSPEKRIAMKQLPTNSTSRVNNGGSSSPSVIEPSPGMPQEKAGPQISIITSNVIATRDQKLVSASESSPIEQNDSTNQTNSFAGSSSMVKVTAPHRVFAHFNGKPSGYFPASATGQTSGNKIGVVFDDGAEDFVPLTGICRLELREGDQVKQYGASKHAKIFIVKETLSKDVSSGSEGALVSTDNLGHNFLKVVAKDSKGANAKDELISMDSIYLTQTMFKSFQERRFVPVAKAEFPTITSTPSIVAGIGTPATPDSRRRYKPLQPLSGTSQSSGLFSNMLFFITNVVSRPDVTSMIQDNHGKVIEEDLTALFDNAQPNATPKAQTALDHDLVDLLPSFTSIHFAAVIADGPYRSAKYLQALALNIPCLSTRWVTDCFNAKRNLDWRHYLLASGESQYLNGATVSRTLSLPSTRSDGNTEGTSIWSLRSMVDERARLFDGTNIMVVGSSESAPLEFIAKVLGAREVTAIRSVSEANKLVKDGAGKWDWLVAGDDKNEKTRRKKISGASEKDPLAITWLGRTRCVKQEFVVQSLILGRLLSQ